MDEPNRYPDEQDDTTRPLPRTQDDPHTASMPPASGPSHGPSHGASAGAAPPAGRKRSGLAAGVLVGALLLGALGGVGGAAAFQAFDDDDSSASSSSSTDRYESPDTASGAPAGTVEKVADDVLPSVVKVNVAGQGQSGSGSGIVLSKDGEILTNNHVVAGADGGSISVNFNDGSTKRATVVGTDPLTDIAVIKAENATDLVAAKLGDSSALRVGQEVVAVGSPYGLNATVTAGIVSALNRPVSVSTQEEPVPQNPFGGGQQNQQGSLSTTYPAIQTDAAINPGNSGGPLVDLSGRVVGINSSIRTASSGLSGDSGGSIGLGFAIPVDEVLPVIDQILKGEKPTHARLGVSVTDASGTQQGAQLGSVEPGGAAAKAGLREGDVITKVGDKVIDGSESLVATIRGQRPGEKVEITYLRGGKTETTTATLGSDANTNDS